MILTINLGMFQGHVMCILYNAALVITFTVCGETFDEKVSVLQPRSKVPTLRNVNIEVRSISIICTFTVYGVAFCNLTNLSPHSQAPVVDCLRFC